MSSGFSDRNVDSELLLPNRNLITVLFMCYSLGRVRVRLNRADCEEMESSDAISF